jgi:hypothetical protein
VIISDIVWADLISWLHARYIRIEKLNGSYKVFDSHGSYKWANTLEEAFLLAFQFGNEP